MVNEFFVRCNCRNRRFTGCKSRFLQAADGGKGIASAANELCGGALAFFMRQTPFPREECFHAGDFAPAGATRGLSARPLAPFGRAPMLLVVYVYWHLVSGKKVHKLKKPSNKIKQQPEGGRRSPEGDGGLCPFYCPLEAASVTSKLEKSSKSPAKTNQKEDSP